MVGLSHELKVDRTTIGRVEENTFQIAEASISSRHCEVLLKGNDVVIKDLGSTNGSFINGEKITESVLKPGQVLRLGQIELKLETGAPGEVPVTAPAAAPGAPAPAPAKKQHLDHTMVLNRGVSLNELEQGGARPSGFDTTRTGFSKKDNKGNKIFWIAVGVFGLVIVGLLLYLGLSIGGK